MELMLIERLFETPSGCDESTFFKIEYDTLVQLFPKLSGQGVKMTVKKSKAVSQGECPWPYWKDLCNLDA